MLASPLEEHPKSSRADAVAKGPPGRRALFCDNPSVSAPNIMAQELPEFIPALPEGLNWVSSKQLIQYHHIGEPQAVPPWNKIIIP